MSALADAIVHEVGGPLRQYCGAAESQGVFWLPPVEQHEYGIRLPPPDGIDMWPLLLREMAKADDLHDESGYHLMEPTLLHFLLRENAAVRLDAFFARAAGKDVSV